ncbi:MAG TPA: hypothetical protein VM598_09330, partial [Bdellovibrionota bacterium]|nr:hypothetical protein [Bdellovibrionota bacterium]
MNFRFFVQMAVTWGLVALWQVRDHVPDTALVILFGLGSAALSLCILHLMDYFSKLRMLPRQS